MRPDKLIRNTTATMLDLTAKALRALADVTGTIAGSVQSQPATTGGEPSASVPDEGPAPATPEPLVAAEDADTVHHPETDLQALAGQPAPAIIGRLGALSDNELAELYELEADGRRRDAVLQAITDASAPPVEPAEPVLPVDEIDITEPADLVYSTETPA
jgi:hypothetical protein